MKPDLDPRYAALAIYQQARAIYLPGGNLPANTPAALAVAIALTELAAAQLARELGRGN